MWKWVFFSCNSDKNEVIQSSTQTQLRVLAREVQDDQRTLVSWLCTQIKLVLWSEETGFVQKGVVDGWRQGTAFGVWWSITNDVMIRSHPTNPICCKSERWRGHQHSWVNIDWNRFDNSTAPNRNSSVTTSVCFRDRSPLESDLQNSSAAIC